MIVVKFRNEEEHHDLLKKVKKMEKFASEVAEMLEECYDEEGVEFRGGSSYHKEYDEDDMRMEGRYGYHRGYKKGM